MSELLKEGPIRKFLRERPTLILKEPLVATLDRVKKGSHHQISGGDPLFKRRITPAEVETIRID